MRLRHQRRISHHPSKHFKHHKGSTAVYTHASCRLARRTSGSWSMSAAVPMECADAPMAMPRGTRLSLPTPIASRTAVPTEAPYTPGGDKIRYKVGAGEGRGW